MTVDSNETRRANGSAVTAPDSVDNDTFDQRVTDEVGEIVERRGLIEQTKGMLMLLYGIDADQAFEILRRKSQQHNVKLALVAEQIVKDLLELSQSTPFDRRLVSDNLVLTAHQRIAHLADRLVDGQSKIG